MASKGLKTIKGSMSTLKISRSRRINWTPQKVQDRFESVGLIIDPKELKEFTYSKSLECLCKRCNQRTKRSLKSIQSTGTRIGCQKCSIKEKSLKSKMTESQAERVLKSVGLKPRVPYPGSQLPWISECVYCKREVSRPLSDIQAAKKRWEITSACAYCNGNRVDDKERILLLEKFGLIPVERYLNNKTPHLYKCVICGKETRQTFINIRRKLRAKAKSFGCPECSFDKSGARRATEIKEVKKRFAEAELEVIGEYKNARTSVACICLRCKRNVNQTLNGINNGKSCRYCSPKGIRYGEPSYLYLIENPNLFALKVGIGNTGNKNDRLHIHINRGWKVIQTWHFDSAEEAKRVEQAVLSWIRQDRRLSAVLSRKEMPQGGHSETIDMRQLSGREIERKVAEMIRNNSRS